VDAHCQRFENSCSDPVHECRDEGLELLRMIRGHDAIIRDESYDDIVSEFETLVNSKLYMSEENEKVKKVGSDTAREIKRIVSKVRSLYLRSLYLQDRGLDNQ